jgi:hypothetical protein
MAKSGDDADEELDVIGVIDQFVDELVMELLLDDSVEAESQLEIDDGRDAIEGKDHEESDGAAPVPLDEDDPRRGCSTGAQAIPEENSAFDSGARFAA